MSRRPQAGEQIRVVEEGLYGDKPEVVHICTVVDVLSVQLRATYEVARGDGGWTERSLFVFNKDVEWDIARQSWKGKV